MIENVKLTRGNQTIEIDRVTTEDYVLDTVNFGEKDTNYTILNTLDIVGVERDIWYKKLSVIEITGWVVVDDRNYMSMARRKMRLNRFVIPKAEMKVVCDGSKEIDFLVTESIRYGKTHTENNEALCRFMISGLYRK
jgi:hypothetical protein